MATFLIAPDFASPCEVQPRVLSSRFGDGYEQRTVDGINTMAENWDLTFSSRTQAEHDQLIAFFRIHAGAQSFNWTSPFGTGGRFVCRKWGATPNTAVANTITARFEQVFDPGTYSQPGIIAGLAWLDQDEDGLQKQSDAGMTGVTVALKSGSTVVSQTVTGIGGAYSFRVNPGSYKILFTAPELFKFTSQGTAGFDLNGLRTLETNLFSLPAGGASYQTVGLISSATVWSTNSSQPAMWTTENGNQTATWERI